MSANPGDTIVAVSSPPGWALRGLLRLSGPRTDEVLAGLMGDEGGQLPPPRQLTVCRLGWGDEESGISDLGSGILKRGTGAVVGTGASSRSEIPNPKSEIPILLARFLAPRSYTGQDMAEIQAPGNPHVLDRLLHRCVALGARLAQPGEFTFRAFLAGKIDLTQAEGVAATIAAVSDSQLQAAHLLREGRLGTWAAQSVDELANLLALVEAGIDFVDQEDVVAISPRKLGAGLSALIGRVDEMLARSRPWGAIEALPRVVLTGAPSTGKSTLFNALLGRQRAVVSPLAGTTRDVLCEPLTLEAESGPAREIMLVDIAGLDAPGNALDKQIQAAAQGAIAAADLLLCVDDGTAGRPAWPGADARAGQLRLHVRTKADLSAAARGNLAEGAGAADDPVAVSARTGEGLEAIRRAIVARLGERAVSVAGQMLALQPRHEEALRGAAGHLGEARKLVETQLEEASLRQPELIAGVMREALDALACLGGSVSADDLIGRVFARFCVGK